MTVAWEIWEQLGGAVPDWLIAPAGHGGTLLGAWRGFQHLRVSGVINKLPRLIAVQAEPYTPLYDAFATGADAVEPTPHVERISADGIAISYPVRWRSLLEAIRFSKGMVLAVAEAEVVQAHEELAAQGIFVEPTSATIAAALKKITADTIPSTDLLVGILTGHGLKNPPRV
jgi:threonine synthase